MARIFLTENFTEGTTRYFAIDDSKIETLNICDTYDRNGQEVGHYNAGDYHFDNSESDAKADCEKAIEKKFNLNSATIVDGEIYSIDGIEADDFANYVEGEGEEEHNKTVDLLISINEFINKWVEENFVLYECEGFTYWDGHNWRTITVETTEGEPSHTIVTDDTLIADLNKAVEEMKFDSEGFGCKIYKGNGYVVVDSFWQGTWAQYEIVPEEEY